MPLVQGVPGLGAQHPGRLLLLEILDEGHGSIGASQVVATWGRKRTKSDLRVKHIHAVYKEIKPTDFHLLIYGMKLKRGQTLPPASRW